MSANMMEFPEDYMEFIKRYSFKDEEEIYTNGSELVPIFRADQMIEHYFVPYMIEQREYDRIKYTTIGEIVDVLNIIHRLGTIEEIEAAMKAYSEDDGK